MGRWAVSLLFPGFGLLAAAFLLVAADDPPTTQGAVAHDFKPAAPHGVLMAWHDQAFGQMRLAIARKDAEKAQQYAWLLAELANVNSTHRADEQFRGFANKLRDECAALAEAAGKGDLERGKQLASQINATCTACHDVYME